MAQKRVPWRPVVSTVMNSLLCSVFRAVIKFMKCMKFILRTWGDLGVDGWIILGRICSRLDVVMWTGLGWPRIETGSGRL